MSESFLFDVFLSHSSKDKVVVRAIAERLRADGLTVWFDKWMLKPGDHIQAKIEKGLEQSRVLVLCMSAQAFGSDWAQLEAGTFLFRDPLNKDRRFIPLRLDDAPIKSSLAQFLYIDWLSTTSREQEYTKLLQACRPQRTNPVQKQQVGKQFLEKVFFLSDAQWVRSVAWSPDGRWVLSDINERSVLLWDIDKGISKRVFGGHSGTVFCVAWSPDGRRAISGANDRTIRLWNIETGQCGQVFNGHIGGVRSVAWSLDGNRVISGSNDRTVRLWNVETGLCERVIKGHEDSVLSVAWSPHGWQVLSGSSDWTIRLWEVETSQVERVFNGHTGGVESVVWSPDGQQFISGGHDQTVRLWNVESGRCERVFEGHTGSVRSVAWSSDGQRVLSGSDDRTVRLWNVETGQCEWEFKGHTDSVRSVAWSSDGQSILSGAQSNAVLIWNVELDSTKGMVLPEVDQVQYTNAKVLVIGDTSAGKTGLTHRLATGVWKSSDSSTVGTWATQWLLKDSPIECGIDREIWLWDFGGQADQRLVHQLYMDHAALILLLFNPDQEDVLSGIRDWQAALCRCIEETTPQFLVAGRVDTGFRASRGKLKVFANAHGFAYYETSAKTGEGCDELRIAINASIPWGQMEKRTSPRLFKRIKDEILKLRDEGQAVHTFKELRGILQDRLVGELGFSDQILRTVIGLLDGPGIVKELDYGTYVLIAPEWINIYAQAVIRTLRSAKDELGALPLRSIAEGNLNYQIIGRDGIPLEMKRLSSTEERVVLSEMERELEKRGLCIRQGVKLVFPSHCGRDRPAVQTHPSVLVSYVVKGYLDDIYATLVVSLVDSKAFKLKELWRDAADFLTLAGEFHMGIKLKRESGSDGNIDVYFGKGVTGQEQVIFANYIDAHLSQVCEHVVRLRHYVCPNCLTPKGNLDALMKRLMEKRTRADTECDGCGKRFPLWDTMEQLFASDGLRRRVEKIKDEHAIRLDSKRKSKLLALEVGARITSADQKCFEILATEDEGLDMELEFTDDDGKGSGKRLYLQLKAGNSHLVKLENGSEVFKVKKQAWVQQWIQQSYPVMLVIGTFLGDGKRMGVRERVKFSDVRWMEVSSVIKRESRNGRKQVEQIVFRGERLDMSSIHKWRRKAFQGELS